MEIEIWKEIEIDSYIHRYIDREGRGCRELP
jgi:hypothetical protein